MENMFYYIYICMHTHTHTHTHTIHTLTHSLTHTIGIRMCQDVLAKQALLEQIMSEKSVLRTRLESESIRNTDLEVCVCVWLHACVYTCTSRKVFVPTKRKTLTVTSVVPKDQSPSMRSLDTNVSCDTNLHP